MVYRMILSSSEHSAACTEYRLQKSRATVLSEAQVATRGSNVPYSSEKYDEIYVLGQKVIELGKAYVWYHDKTDLTKQRLVL